MIHNKSRGQAPALFFPVEGENGGSCAAQRRTSPGTGSTLDHAAAVCLPSSDRASAGTAPRNATDAPKPFWRGSEGNITQFTPIYNPAEFNSTLSFFILFTKRVLMPIFAQRSQPSQPNHNRDFVSKIKGFYPKVVKL